MKKTKEVIVQSRWKSIATWTALTAQVLAILQMTGVIELSQVDNINNVITAVLQLAAALGILNNPTAKNAF